MSSPKKLAIKIKDLNQLVKVLQRNYKVYAPQSKNGESEFRELVEPELELTDCPPSILPPKKIFQSVRGTLFTFTIKNTSSFQCREELVDEPRAVLGLRPCDVHALLTLDQVFNEKYPDPYYLTRRERGLIIAITCTEVTPECFCTSFGTGPYLKNNYDLLLTNLGDEYLLEVGSDKGSSVVSELNGRPAAQPDFARKNKLIQLAKGKIIRHLPIPLEALDKYLAETFDHRSWQRQADYCLSCGNCTLVCPTCHCFNVTDNLKPSISSGERVWEWDSCQLLEFSKIALSANFRRLRLDRFKHRAIHKLSWMKQQYGRTGCVGCGRCARWCPSLPERRGRLTSLADPIEIIADLLE
jgi:ferredoxin